MSTRYRIRAEHDSFERLVNGGEFTIEKKTGWFFWQYVAATNEPSEFEAIIEKDMEERRQLSEAAYHRQSFGTIHALAYWLARFGKPGEADLRITVDTKG